MAGGGTAGTSYRLQLHFDLLVSTKLLTELTTAADGGPTESVWTPRSLPQWSSRNADAWPLLACGATLSLDGLREVRFPIRADFHNAARLQQLHARDETGWW